MAVLLLLWLAALLASSSASAPGFDYFVLALQWPGTVCRSSAAGGPCCSSNACCRWALAKLCPWERTNLLQQPRFRHGKEKHGTCSYPVIQDEYSYFSTTLHLYSSYNVTALLASKISIGADDGGRYLVADLVATVRSSFGASPLLLCEGGSLQELRLCFDKDLKPLDCINGGTGNEYDIIEHGRSCARYISLPSYKPHGDDTSGATRRFSANIMLTFFDAF
ncbi:hypothetical protein C2845_PM04G21960 [Panicum miliaceum]|uniref:Uncharacterized protein n=1 Tax=Panicum miliaceum TaxID=4540 RepID=A0A3L6QNS0_PANMI|nr:hypothetical protein C2845_PM04G21960 [Panicum miliaceum]